MHGTFQTESHLFCVMEYLPGGDMYEIVTSVELQEPEVMFYTACVVLGLEALHHLGIVHRDIKLENLLLDRDGYLKIVDFGLSKDRFGYSDRTNTMCGTKAYIAPEIFLKHGYGMAVDWWALGITTYIMLMCEVSTIPILSTYIGESLGFILKHISWECCFAKEIMIHFFSYLSTTKTRLS
ncbi:cAMP-dependent protein kinase catalytic subunit gamma-like [Xenopus tropicalis]|nr:cAMP-dependent protein kinase catalytic subunit gamma-like [Xenopus tropicalis]XP_031756482.1 cAMP-dependent protein kinase catalytic subunit gamma-like [Xenopus tropicalis]XP_031756483.1 cAMP-dependent protein kinase catalytic subunit gamma-like [Xenopus tropicalis]